MSFNHLDLPKLNPFSLDITYVNIDSSSPKNQFEHHVHAECEIYVNLSGDVSFMVEDQIYPITPGSMIITKPYEYHHCIYHSNALHKHYWILFSAAGNESLLELFFNRAPGTRNLLVTPPEQHARLFAVLENLLKKERSLLLQYRSFFELLELMNRSNSDHFSESDQLSPDLVLAIRYLNQNLTAPISMQTLADTAHVSLNTLERHFRSALKMTPGEYLKRRRLSLAMELLRGGATVSEACIESGFSDCSAFIGYFRRFTGLTPLRYQKSHTAPND